MGAPRAGGGGSVGIEENKAALCPKGVEDWGQGMARQGCLLYL